MSPRIIVTDGPYQLTDADQVVAQAGDPRQGLQTADLSAALDQANSAWLCRCGHSTMKPACDGAHTACDNGGRFDGADSTTPLHTWPAGGSSPMLTITSGSALEIENIDVQGQDGSVVEMKGKAAVLCRCGLSTVKPGCDGTCREHGFQD